MGKKINLDIKNKQLAEALNLGSLREKLAKRAGSEKEAAVGAEKEEAKKKAEPEIEKDDSQKKVAAELFTCSSRTYSSALSASPTWRRVR